VPTPPQQHEQIRLKWADWLKRVEPEVFRMGFDREIRRDFLPALVAVDPNGPDTFIRHYMSAYRDTQAMAIRRLMLSRRTDQRSLASLIANLVGHPDLLDRTRYVELVEGPPGGDDDAWRAGTARRFDEEFGDGTGQLDVTRLHADLTRINNTCAEVTDFADGRIAHVGDTSADPTWDDIDRCIDLAEELFVKYALLLTGAGWILPPIVDPLWKRTFTKPIFPDPSQRLMPPSPP
jgi:hypothetical protein